MKWFAALVLLFPVLLAAQPNLFESEAFLLTAQNKSDGTIAHLQAAVKVIQKSATERSIVFYRDWTDFDVSATSGISIEILSMGGEPFIWEATPNDMSAEEELFTVSYPPELLFFCTGRCGAWLVINGARFTIGERMRYYMFHVGDKLETPYSSDPPAPKLIIPDPFDERPKIIPPEEKPERFIPIPLWKGDRELVRP